MPMETTAVSLQRLCTRTHDRTSARLDWYCYWPRFGEEEGGGAGDPLPRPHFGEGLNCLRLPAPSRHALLQRVASWKGMPFPFWAAPVQQLKWQGHKGAGLPAQDRTALTDSIVSRTSQGALLTTLSPVQSSSFPFQLTHVLVHSKHPRPQVPSLCLLPEVPPTAKT